MTKILTKHFDEPRLHELETYRKLGGYKALEKARAMTSAQIQDEVKKSTSALGRSGLPVGMKWRRCRRWAAERYVVANADETEPGCFKDRAFMQRAPHQVRGAIDRPLPCRRSGVHFHPRRIC